MGKKAERRWYALDGISQDISDMPLFVSFDGDKIVFRDGTTYRRSADVHDDPWWVKISADGQDLLNFNRAESAALERAFQEYKRDLVDLILSDDEVVVSDPTLSL